MSEYQQDPILLFLILLCVISFYSVYFTIFAKLISVRFECRITVINKRGAVRIREFKDYWWFAFVIYFTQSFKFQPCISLRKFSFDWFLHGKDFLFQVNFLLNIINQQLIDSIPFLRYSALFDSHRLWLINN